MKEIKAAEVVVLHDHVIWKAAQELDTKLVFRNTDQSQGETDEMFVIDTNWLTENGRDKEDLQCRGFANILDEDPLFSGWRELALLYVLMK